MPDLSDLNYKTSWWLSVLVCKEEIVIPTLLECCQELMYSKYIQKSLLFRKNSILLPKYFLDSFFSLQHHFLVDMANIHDLDSSCRLLINLHKLVGDLPQPCYTQEPASSLYTGRLALVSWLVFWELHGECTAYLFRDECEGKREWRWPWTNTINGLSQVSWGGTWFTKLWDARIK